MLLTLMQRTIWEILNREGAATVATCLKWRKPVVSGYRPMFVAEMKSHNLRETVERLQSFSLDCCEVCVVVSSRTGAGCWSGSHSSFVPYCIAYSFEALGMISEMVVATSLPSMSLYIRVSSPQQTTITFTTRRLSVEQRTPAHVFLSLRLARIKGIRMSINTEMLTSLHR